MYYKASIHKEPIKKKSVPKKEFCPYTLQKAFDLPPPHFQSTYSNLGL